VISKKAANILRVAFRALARNKLRSLLTALGIIIGVACVVATIGIGEGARLQAENQLKSLGTNFLMIFPGTTTPPPAPGPASGPARSSRGRRGRDPPGGLDRLVRLGFHPHGRAGHLRQPELVDVDPGRARWTGRSSARGTSRRAVLHGPGHHRRRQGLRPRPDRRDEPLRRRGPDRQDDPDQEHPVQGRGRPRGQGRLGRWARTRTTSSSRPTRRSARSSWGRRRSARSSSRPRRTTSSKRRRRRSRRCFASATAS
jgi:hypothetical protein